MAPPESPHDRDEPERGEKGLERALRELMRRVIEAGVDRLGDGPEGVRQKIADLKLPREAILALLGTLDDTKSGLYRVVAREVRDFLEHSNLADEVVRGLTALSFEIKTEVRFIPNDARAGRPTPDVRSKVSVKRSSMPPNQQEGAEKASQTTESGRQSSPPPRRPRTVKALSAGSEIDAWCTRCRMDLGHRIVAMVGGAPKRVVCLTCNAEHNFRAPKELKDISAVVMRSNGGATAVKAPAKAPKTSAARVTQKARAEQERVDGWSTRTVGKSVDAFTKYSMEHRFEAGELVLHSKFGEGYVDTVLDGAKISVMFRDGARTLAHRPAS